MFEVILLKAIRLSGFSTTLCLYLGSSINEVLRNAIKGWQLNIKNEDTCNDNINVENVAEIQNKNYTIGSLES